MQALRPALPRRSWDTSASSHFRAGPALVAHLRHANLDGRFLVHPRTATLSGAIAASSDNLIKLAADKPIPIFALSRAILFPCGQTTFVLGVEWTLGIRGVFLCRRRSAHPASAALRQAVVVAWLGVIVATYLLMPDRFTAVQPPSINWIVVFMFRHHRHAVVVACGQPGAPCLPRDRRRSI